MAGQMHLLPDKVALITGAARGIGRAVAEAFAEHGASVAVADVLDDLRARTVLGRIATPRDQANAAVFLASDLAAHITGEGAGRVRRRVYGHLRVIDASNPHALEGQP